LSGIAAAN